MSELPFWTNTAAFSLSASALPTVSCKDMKTFTKGNQLNTVTPICSTYTLDLGGSPDVFKADCCYFSCLLPTDMSNLSEVLQRGYLSIMIQRCIGDLTHLVTKPGTRHILDQFVVYSVAFFYFCGNIMLS